MNSYFSSDFFVGNRAQLRQTVGHTAPIILTANGLLQRGGDSAYAFKQDANFWYLTCIDEPDIVLVMEKDREYLIVPVREQSREAFDGRIDDEALRAASGIGDIVDETEGWKRLKDRVRRSKRFATVGAPPAYIAQHGLYTNPARQRLIDRLLELVPAAEQLDIGLELVGQRMVKQPAELAAIQAAIDTTAAALKTVTKPAALRKYKYEYEIEADLSRLFRRSGAQGHAFDPIVASGERACTLHNVANNGPLAADELLVLDIGAEVSNYAADITRTVSIGGTPTDRQQAVFDAVRDVQEFAKKLLKPGVYIKQYENDVEQYMGRTLKALGLIEKLDHAEIRKCYPHSTSHHLGLNVHDAADYTQPLAPGMVITVEPGIYIPAEGIGVRIEDDVVITETGIKVLTDTIPRNLN